MNFVCDFMEVRFENEVFRMRFLGGSYDDVVSLRRSLYTFRKNGVYLGYPCIVDISNIEYLSSAVLDFLASEEVLSTFSTIAVVYDNPVSKLIYSVFMKRVSSNRFITSFSDEIQASIWINQSYESSIA